MSHLADHILGLHGWVALAVIFAVPASESSAFLGFMFPGEVAVLLGGVLAFQHRVSLPAAIAAAVLGAIIGDTVGYADRQANRRWVAFLRARFRRQLDFLVRRLRPSQTLGLSLTVSLALIGVAGWALGALTQGVLSRESLNPIDRAVLLFFVRHREPWLTGCNKVVTALGSSAVLIPLIVVIGLAWWWRRRTWRPSVLLAGAYLGAEGLFNVVKVLVGRPRPPMALAVAHFSGLAFPSGHATLTMAVWGMLAALAADATTRWSRKVAAWAAALLVAGLVGVTRLYLGAHWLTDVAGGWALGALWLFALLTTVRTVAVLGRGPSRTVAAGRP